jgi:ATP-dependent protease ClpP protease subunit
MNHPEYIEALTRAGLTGDEATRVARWRASQRPAAASIRLEKPEDEDEDDEAELYVYGPVGFSFDGDGMTPKMLIDALEGIGPVARLTVRINSPGGDAFDALAITNILQRQPCTVAVSIDGLAASAASIVAMAASKGELSIAENAMVMVHRAWALAVGNKNEMLDMASILEKIDGQIAATYAARSGRQAQTWLKMMEDETWMTGGEAVQEKFADKIVEAKKAAACLRMKDLANFRNAPPAWVERVRAEKEQRKAAKKTAKAERKAAKAAKAEAEAVAVRLRLLELEEAGA